MIDLLHLVALGLYAGAALLLGLSLARGLRRLPAVASILLAGALVIHTWGLTAYTIRWAELPLVGLGPSLSSLAVLIGVATLVAATLGHAGTVGLVLVPVVVLLLGAATAVGIAPTEEQVAFRGVWFVAHVVFAFIGYVGLTIAFGAGLMYLLQFRELKSKRFGAIFRFFPPLDTLDRLGKRGVLLGFPSLTVALLVGWAWSIRFGHPVGIRNPQVLWGVVTWMVFLAALLARTGGGRRGHRAAVASVIGFALVWVIYLVLRVQTVSGGFL